MRYTMHNEHLYTKKQARAKLIATVARTITIAVGGASAGHLIIQQDFVVLAMVVVLTAAAIVAIHKAPEAERTVGQSNALKERGKSGHLSFGQVGLHFEPGVLYTAELLKRLPQEDGHDDFLYLIEDVPTGEHYLVDTFRELPHDSFICEYGESGLHFYPQEKVLH